MKQILLLLAGTCLATGAYAQKASRMIASSGYDYDGATYVLTDTTRYTYTGDRGGSVNNIPTNIKCDTAQNFVSNAGSLVPQQLTVVSYTSQNNVSEYNLYGWDAGTSTYKISGRYIITYVSIGGVEYQSTQASQSWDAATSSWKNVEKISQFYGSDNLPDTLVRQTWDAPSSAWKNVIMVSNVYDGSGIMTSQTSLKWNTPTSKWFLDRRELYQIHSGQKTGTIRQTYNTATTSWDNVTRYLYTYDAGGNTTSETTEQWNGSAWVGDNKVVMTYDANNRKLTHTLQYWDAGQYKNGSQFVYTYDANGNQLEELNTTWNNATSTWKNYLRNTYTYNSYNQRTSYIDATWNAGGFWEFTTSDGASYYYYEEYTLGVEQAKATAGMLNMYPNPATHTLNVNLTWNKPQPFTISIYDMSGRMVYTRNEAATAQYSRSLSLSAFENGNYILMCKGADGTMHQMFTVAK